MIKIQVVEIATGKVVQEVEVRAATKMDDREVERVELGLLRNMNFDKYFTRPVVTE